MAWEKRSRMNQEVVWDLERPLDDAGGLIDSYDTIKKTIMKSNTLNMYGNGPNVKYKSLTRHDK